MDIGRNLRDLPEFKLRAMERAVAKEHLDKFPWFSLFWAVANMLTWILISTLVFAGEISIYVAFPIACINLTLFYLPSHE